MQLNRPFTAHLVNSRSLRKKKSEEEWDSDGDDSYFTSYTPTPIEYENFIIRNKSSLMTDPNRDLVLFPTSSDIKMFYISRETKEGILSLNTVPRIIKQKFETDPLSISNTLTRHMLSLFLKQNWLCVQVSNISFRGGFADLARDRVNDYQMQLKPEWFLIDSCLHTPLDRGDSFSAAQKSLSSVKKISTTNEDALVSGSISVFDHREYQNFMQLAEKQPSQVDYAINCKEYCIRPMLPHETAFLESIGRSKNIGSYVIITEHAKIVHGTDLDKIIFLDCVCDVKSIGSIWLRLEIKPITNKILKTNNEDFVFLLFPPKNLNDPGNGTNELRLNWLKHLRQVIDWEKEHSRLGYSVPLSVRKISQDCPALDRIHDINSISSSLNKFSVETETLINQNRHKDRLRLITLYPEIRLAIEATTQQTATRQDQMSSFAKALQSGTEYNSDSKQATGSAAFIPFVWKLNKSIFLSRSSNELPSVRFLISCQSFQTAIRASIDHQQISGSIVDNPEPFFLTLYLVDAIEGKRISEEFHCDLNSSAIRSMLSQEANRHPSWQEVSTTGSKKAPAPAAPVNPQGLPTPLQETIGKSRSCMFSLFAPALSMLLSKAVASQEKNSNTLLNNLRGLLATNSQAMHSLKHYFLVVRVAKVLSGPVNQALEKYSKSSHGKHIDGAAEACKVGYTINKSMQAYCKNIGHYKMPFAWGCRPLISRSADIKLFKWDAIKCSESNLMCHIQNVHLLYQKYGFNSFGSVSVCTSTDVDGLEAVTNDVLEKTVKSSIVPARLSILVKLVDPFTFADLPRTFIWQVNE
ncbi:Dedicator of cytokinesis protein 10 [Cichlidogyrus casuarinus]|uniref:Dedicator of cytokinesis protein 10 n=1 Tax=Cichlidogyrus casuarinus TaxID=1844966 RepID=A0ABD2QGY0_9PLAT